MNIESYKGDRVIISKLIEQLRKDFQFYDEKFVLQEESTTQYDDLYQQVLPIIDRMLNLDSARFFSLLYAIDIDERKVKDLLFGNNDKNAGAELCHLILERELLKVVSRHIYSQTSNINIIEE